MIALSNRGESSKKPWADTGLIIAVSITPSGYRLLSTRDVDTGSSEIPRPNVWLHVSPNETVKVYVAKSEMGQGVLTALPMIAADELEVEWKQVRAEMAPAGEEYKDPVWREQTTGGSTSVRHMFWPLRKAGAAARELLVLAAAREWGIPAAECEASHGKVSHPESGRALTYGQLSEKAAGLSADCACRGKCGLYRHRFALAAPSHEP
jgi:isoquinoline 1-oxidoreductase beta subunit